MTTSRSISVCPLPSARVLAGVALALLAGCGPGGGEPDGGVDAASPFDAPVSEDAPGDAADAADTGESCDHCLDTSCASELAACDDGCLAIEACIRAVCRHLGELGSPEEGACDVACQMEHPSSRTAHIGVAACSGSAECSGPCSGAVDYVACRAERDAGACASALAACDGDADCRSYRDCTASCASASECDACASTPAGSAGKTLLTAYEHCIAEECVLEAWRF